MLISACAPSRLWIDAVSHLHYRWHSRHQVRRFLRCTYLSMNVSSTSYRWFSLSNWIEHNVIAFPNWTESIWNQINRCIGKEIKLDWKNNKDCKIVLQNWFPLKIFCDVEKIHVQISNTNPSDDLTNETTGHFKESFLTFQRDAVLNHQNTNVIQVRG